MNTPSKTWTRVRLVVCGALLAVIGVALALISTASHSQPLPQGGTFQCVDGCVNGNWGEICWNSFTHVWLTAKTISQLQNEGGKKNFPELSCSAEMTRAGPPPIDICKSYNSIYDSYTNSCICNPGFAKVGDGTSETIGCFPCPGDTTWDVKTRSCVCLGGIENFDTKDFACKPRPRIPHHECPVGMQWNTQTNSCDHGCGDEATWNEGAKSCVCNDANETFYPSTGGRGGYCQCTYLGNTGDNTPGCPPPPMPAAGGCPRGQTKSRTGKCIPIVLRPTTDPTATKRTVPTTRTIPPAGLLETTPGLSPQGPAGMGTPSGGGSLSGARGGKL
jgi:hypothetical protein